MVTTSFSFRKCKAIYGTQIFKVQNKAAKKPAAKNVPKAKRPATKIF